MTPEEAETVQAFVSLCTSLLKASQAEWAAIIAAADAAYRAAGAK